MKKRVVAAALLFALCVTFFAASHRANAAQFMCFTAVNDELLPLRASSLPAYFGTVLYVPGNVFTRYLGLSAGYSDNNNRYYLYRERQTNLRLDFYVDSGETYDAAGMRYSDASARLIDGIIFFPVELVCDYFGFTLSVIPSEPASVLRIKNISAITNDKTFIGMFRDDMRRAFDEYYAAPSPSATPTVSTQPSAQPSSAVQTTPPAPTYETVTLYFSFYSIETPAVKRAMNALETRGLRGCFYLTDTDVLDDPSLVREIAGRGHTVGLWLENGTYEAYERTSALLFEAAKLKSPLVASPNNVSAETREMSDAHGLIFRGDPVSYDTTKPTQRVPTTQNARAELRIRCGDSQSRALADALDTLLGMRYTVRTLVETSNN